MEKRILQSTLLNTEAKMYVWRWGKYNDSNEQTHFITVTVRYLKKMDLYDLTIRQEPYNSKKGAKVIQFYAERKHLEGILSIAKIKGDLEL